MTVINPNSISGVASVTAQGDIIQFYKSDGTLGAVQFDGANFNTTSGISTFKNLYVGGTLTYEDVKNVDAVGLVTARAGIIDSTLTAGRVTYAGTNGRLVDSANLTFNGSDLLIDAATNEYKGVKFDNSFNLTFGSSSGTSPRLYLKGTSNSQSDAGDTFLATGTGGEQWFQSNTFTAFKVDADGTTKEGLRIDSSGRVLIGTTTEGESTADDLTIANTGSGGITIRSGTSGEGNIFFSDGTSGTAEYEGTIQYSHGSNYMLFFTNHVERLRIDSSGYLKHTGLRAGNSENKLAILVTPSYNTSEEDVIVYQAENETGSNQLTIGGGTGSYNATTTLRFLTASAVNTTGGEERLRITSTGLIYVNRDSVGGRIDATAGDGSMTFSDGNGRQTVKITTMASGQSAAHVFDANGRLGIGTDSPSYKLQVHNSDGALLRVLTGHESTYDLRYVYQNSEANIWSYGSTDLTFGTRYNKKLHLVTNGPGKRLTIDGSGLVGIGDDSPTVSLSLKRNQTSNHYVRLENINSSSTYIGLSLKTPTLDCQIWNQGPNGGGYGGANSMNFYQSGTYGPYAFYHGTDERLRINTGGQVLIGHTAVIGHNGVDGYLQVTGTGSDSSSFNLNRFSDDNWCPFITFGKSRNVAKGNHTIVQDDDYIGYIQFSASDGTDFNNAAANIICQIDGTPNTDVTPGRLIFKTSASNSNSPTERLRISADGFLLLNCQDTGFSSGYTDMTIGNTSESNTGLTIASSPTNGYSRIHFADGTSGGAKYAGFIAYNHGSDEMLFGTGNSGSTKFCLNSDGAVQFGNGSVSGGNYSSGGAINLIDFGSGTLNRGMGWGGTTANYANIWTEHSSGALHFGIGIRPTGTSTGWVSSYGGGSIGRSALKMDLNGDIRIFTGSSSTIAAGSATNLTEKLLIHRTGQITHQFAGRYGTVIGSTDGSGAYIMLDGEGGNPIASGSDYMYMEHTSTGQFEMWNGKTGVTVTKFMDVHPEGYMRLPKKPLWDGDGFSAGATAVQTNIIPLRATRVNVNQGGHFDNSTGIFTCPVAGYYQIHGYVNRRASYNLWLGIYVTKNGGTMSSTWWPPITADGGSFTASHFTYMPLGIQHTFYCSANDELALCYHQSYSAPGNANDVSWHIELIS